MAEEADHPPLSQGEAAEVTGEEVVNVEAVKGVPDTRPHLQKPVATGITFTGTRRGTAWPPTPAPGWTNASKGHEGPASLTEERRKIWRKKERKKEK